MQVGSGDCPHTLFYGPNGAGKKTLILAFLREIYGAGADKVLAICLVHSLHANPHPPGDFTEYRAVSPQQVKVETRPWKIQVTVKQHVSVIH